MLARLEGPAEEAMRREAAEEWRRLDEVRREARKGVVSGEVAEVTAVAREVLKEDEEEVVEEDGVLERLEGPREREKEEGVRGARATVR